MKQEGVGSGPDLSGSQERRANFFSRAGKCLKRPREWEYRGPGVGPHSNFPSQVYTDARCRYGIGYTCYIYRHPGWRRGGFGVPVKGARLIGLRIK